MQAVPGVPEGGWAQLVGGHTHVHALAELLPGVLAVFCLVSGLLKAKVIRAARSGVFSSHILLSIRQCLPCNV